MWLDYIQSAYQTLKERVPHTNPHGGILSPYLKKRTFTIGRYFKEGRMGIKDQIVARLDQKSGTIKTTTCENLNMGLAVDRKKTH